MRRWPHNFDNRQSFALLVLLASFALPPIAAAKVRQAPIPGNPSRNRDEEVWLEGQQPRPAPVPETPATAAPFEFPNPEKPELDEEIPSGLIPWLPRQAGGLSGEYIYTGEIFTNARGGLATAHSTSYRGNLDLVAQLDTGKQGLWEGGTFFIYGQSNHGRSISTDFVGDYQLLSNLDPSPRLELAQISEYWYLHQWNDGDYMLKLGKQDANADFAFANLGGDFINSSFGLIPTVPLPTFPDPAMGVAGGGKITDSVTLKAGVYDGAPYGGGSGFSTLGDNGAMTLLQVEFIPPKDFEAPTVVRLGAWHHSGDWEEITTSPTPRMFADNYGVWATVDRLFWAEPDFAESEQGLSGFAQFGWAPGDRNPVDLHYGAGIVYRGWFEGRDADVCGAGITAVVFSNAMHRVNGATREIATELFYKAYLTDHLSLPFDLQYISLPNGFLPDALAPGVRFEAVF